MESVGRGGRIFCKCVTYIARTSAKTHLNWMERTVNSPLPGLAQYLLLAAISEEYFLDKRPHCDHLTILPRALLPSPAPPCPPPASLWSMYCTSLEPKHPVNVNTYPRIFTQMNLVVIIRIGKGTQSSVAVIAFASFPLL